MQTTQLLEAGQLATLLEAIYEQGEPIVKEAYSDYGSPTKSFPTLGDLQKELRRRKKFFFHSIYYPETKGKVRERRIKLNPDKCSGHSHRFTQEGWALISLQLTFKNRSIIECNVSVNTEVRANSWASTSPELGSPDLWDWAAVKRHAGRLVRLVRKLGKQRAAG